MDTHTRVPMSPWEKEQTTIRVVPPEGKDAGLPTQQFSSSLAEGLSGGCQSQLSTLPLTGTHMRAEDLRCCGKKHP